MRFWKREWLFWTVALLGLAAVAGAAWLTWNPDSPWLERATAWPIVGPVASDFRARYLPAEELPAPSRGLDPSAPTALVSPEQGVATPEAVAAAIEGPVPGPRGARPRVWLTRRTPLRESPSASAQVVTTVEPVATLVQRGRRGDWYELEWGGGTAWAHLPGYSETSDPPLGRAPTPVGPVPDLAPDPDHLAAAVAELGPRHQRARLGDYGLTTDVADDKIASRLGPVVASLEGAYRERYGLAPLGSPRAEIVVFARERSYLAFKGLEASLSGRRSSGHVGRGVVALYSEGRTGDEVRSTLLHELIHLLNRRAIGPALPPWLDEGLAEDLSGSAVGVEGELLAGTLASTTVVEASGWRATGAEAALIQLQRAYEAGKGPSIRDLCSASEERFHDRGHQTVNYALSGFWIRFLMDRYPDETRSFLASVAGGEPASAESLRGRLQLSWRELQTELEAWLLAMPSGPDRVPG